MVQGAVSNNDLVVVSMVASSEVHIDYRIIMLNAIFGKLYGYVLEKVKQSMSGFERG